MLDWFRRYQQRERELAAGVDGDLVKSNRTKGRIALGLFGLGILLLGVNRLVKPDSLIEEILFWFIWPTFAAGLILGKWAQVERAFLDEPEPKKPPSLFK